MEELEIKIQKWNSGYEGVRKSTVPDTRGQWNLHGRKYTLQGLYNLSKTPGITLILPEEIQAELKAYEQRKSKSLAEK